MISPPGSTCDNRNGLAKVASASSRWARFIRGACACAGRWKFRMDSARSIRRLLIRRRGIVQAYRNRSCSHLVNNGRTKGQHLHQSRSAAEQQSQRKPIEVFASEPPDDHGNPPSPYTGNRFDRLHAFARKKSASPRAEAKNEQGQDPAPRHAIQLLRYAYVSIIPMSTETAAAWRRLVLPRLGSRGRAGYCLHTRLDRALGRYPIGAPLSLRHRPERAEPRST
jgi:hypothetical protein